MQPTTTIRLLTSTTNKKGDLFTRLMKDLFYTLSYEDLRLDVHKAGREIDIQGRHRHEGRLLVAECKAHEKKMGGAELNKFFGALTRERKKASQPVMGYFVSLGGFTETGIDQEAETGADRIILMEPVQIIRQLEQSRFLVTDTVAAERAGQCASRAGLGQAAAESIELLGHEMGYIKAVYYQQHKQRTHFALIHADGTPLAPDTAQIIIDADQVSGGSLHRLEYLPPVAVVDHAASEAAAMDLYRRWLGEECGFIYMDGLPAGANISTQKLALERMFVPLRAVLTTQQEPPSTDSKTTHEPDTVQIGNLIQPGAHVALLAAPGGGKSTLLKRLATFYAFEDAQSEDAEHLAKRAWLPLFMRCRELRERAGDPILTLLEQLPAQVNMPVQEASAFRAHLHESLRAGRILLLIDGLDEIADEGNRKRFAHNLRTFLAVFPQTTLVVTSREAGFRLVAGVIASICQHARLAPFSKEDVERLSVQWHVEISQDNDEVRRKALVLAADIWANQRIRGLAGNPLLLTTLLVVNKWIGQIPKNRATLYGKAVDVLIRTWNSEAFGPLDEEETLAQLSYVACVMMEQGIQQITRRALLQTLRQAHDVLVAELRFATVSPAKFIDRVEYRSSLLMQTGSAFIDGELQELYEFRHLTFQEYLAARGYVEGQHPRRNNTKDLAALLNPHFTDESWREVIALSVVLAKRNAESTLEQLVASCYGDDLYSDDAWTVVDLLCQCLLDEITVSSTETLSNALRTVGRFAHFMNIDGQALRIVNTKFGNLFREVIEREITEAKPYWSDYMQFWNTLELIQIKTISPNGALGLIDSILDLLTCGDELTELRAAGCLAEAAFESCLPLDYETIGDNFSYRTPAMVLKRDDFNSTCNKLVGMLRSEKQPVIYSACSALIWLHRSTGEYITVESSVVVHLFRKWYDGSGGDPDKYELMKLVGETLEVLSLLERDALHNERLYTIDTSRLTTDDLMEESTQSRVDVLACWYRLIKINDNRFAQLIHSAYPVQLNKLVFSEDPVAEQMFHALGEEGERALIARAEQRRTGTPQSIGEEEQF